MLAGSETLVEKHGRYVLSPWSMQGAKTPVIVRGQGCRIFDADGKEYIDLSAGLVAVNLGGAHQLGVDAAGSLWEAGAERSDPDRFFRMEATGTIDRSAAFPTVGGSTLHTDGTLIVSNDGALWASAQTSSGHEYLVRFVPTP